MVGFQIEAHPDGAAISRNHIPGVVELHVEYPDTAVPTRRGHHRHHRPRSVLHHDRIGGHRLLIRQASAPFVAQQVVTAPGDDHIHPRQARYQFDLLRHVLEMADQDDQVHPLSLQSFHLGLNGGQHRRDHHIAGTRDVGKHRGDRTDHTDPLTTGLDHGAGGDQALVDQRLQLGFSGEVQVGRQERDGRLESCDEPGRHLGTHVEVVVAQSHGVIDTAERDGVVQRPFPRQRHAELLGSQEVVTRGERNHRFTSRNGLQPLHQSNESSHTRIRTLIG